MKALCLFALALVCITGFAQKPAFSLASHFSLLRNFTPKEKFWARGQNVEVNLHFSPRQAGYVSIDYYTEGTFKNNFTATAKSASASPQAFPFTATGALLYRELSLGMKRYFKGAYRTEEGINIWGTAGFGFLFARVRNVGSVSIDTAYASPVLFGQTTIKRLSFDAGLGIEAHFRGTAYPFFTLRTWLPLSGQSSGYLYNNKVPLTLMAGVGVRVLFGYDY